MIKNEHKKAIE